VAKEQKKGETMAKKSNGNSTGWKVAAGVLLGGLALYYIKAGAGSEHNAALIPDAIEDQLDRVVDALNRKFGRTWVKSRLATLEQGLSSMLPTPLVALVSVVQQTEQWAEGQRLRGRFVTGAQKRRYAAASYAGA